ncbi:MAG: mediator complex subunit, partial [Watsoniomyces obsoletus]
MVKAVSHGPRAARAIALVDRRGRLSLVYMRPDACFAKVTTELVEGNGTLFTHAAFSSTLEGKLLVALHSYNAVLSTYLVRIGFPDPRQGPDAMAALSVDLAISSLPLTSVGGLMDGQAYDPDSYCLTHLGVIPPSEVEKAEHSRPTLFGIYSSVNRRVNVTDPGFLIGSVIRRWTISSVEQTLHESFEDLDPPSATTAPIFTSRSQRLQDKDEQLITSVSLVDNGQI